MAPWMVRLVLVDDAVADEGGADHDLDGRHAAEAVGARHQPLRDGPLQHAGELDADLALLVRREDGDDAVDRLGGVERVERREHQVARLGGEQRRLDVSWSRISPTRMTSGSCRRALRSACENDWVSTAISRWLTIERWSRWRYSIGSSIVMMCVERVALM
jgi:hypothetical protein